MGRLSAAADIKSTMEDILRQIQSLRGMYADLAGSNDELVLQLFLHERKWMSPDFDKIHNELFSCVSTMEQINAEDNHRMWKDLGTDKFRTDDSWSKSHGKSEHVWILIEPFAYHLPFVFIYNAVQKERHNIHDMGLDKFVEMINTRISIKLFGHVPSEVIESFDVATYLNIFSKPVRRQYESHLSMRGIRTAEDIRRHVIVKEVFTDFILAMAIYHDV